MAQKETITYVDSLTGKDLDEKSGRNAVFIALNSDGWQLDLSDDSIGKLYEALEKFTKSEEKVSAREHYASRKPAAKAAAGPAFTPEEREAIAAWAAANGLPPVSERGRIRKATVEGWQEAGKPSVGDSKDSGKGASNSKPAKKAAPKAEFTESS